MPFAWRTTLVTPQHAWHYTHPCLRTEPAGVPAEAGRRGLCLNRMFAQQPQRLRRCGLQLDGTALAFLRGYPGDAFAVGDAAGGLHLFNARSPRTPKLFAWDDAHTSRIHTVVVGQDNCIVTGMHRHCTHPIPRPQ